MAALKGEIVARLEGYQGRVGFALLDLKTGRRLEINGRQPFIAASVIKLFTMLSVLRDVEAGLYPLEEVEEDIDALMAYSDNEANARLTRRTGLQRINALMQELGMEHSIYNSWPGVPETYGSPDPENYLTARDLVTALAALYRGKAFATPEFTELALAKMMLSIPEHNGVIPRYLPPEAAVAHKVGFIPPWEGLDTNVFSDAGIVILPDDRAYAIAFLSQDNADYLAAADLGAELALLAYEHLASP